MAERLGPKDTPIVITFGGGVHSRASEYDIHDLECTSGENFILDPVNREFRNRECFDLIGTVPNASEIRGYANLIQSDGTIMFAIQAGNKVYDWDGATTFTEIATVSASAKLRGRMEHNWSLADKVIVTDLNLAQPVMEWDGVYFQNASFFDLSSNPWTGTFSAKYCVVQNERAMFANIDDNGTGYPHMIVGSQRGDFTVISTGARPSSAAAPADPFFMVQLDNRPINGFVSAFDVIASSSFKGAMNKITGSDSTDFAVNPMYPMSGASGDESMVYTGSDIMYGKNGRIESLLATDKFGNVEQDDLSLKIADLVKGFSGWNIVYNSRLQRVYCLPSGNQSQIWVYHTPLAGLDVSPWSKWTTIHSTAYNPTCIWNALDPVDGLEYTWFGDSSGNFYRLEGSGSSDVLNDGGTAQISCTRLSKQFDLPMDAEMYDIEGWITYRKRFATSVTLGFEFAGNQIFNETKTINLDTQAPTIYWGGSIYWGQDIYFGIPFAGRFSRKIFSVGGRSNSCQLRVTVNGDYEFRIAQVGLRVKAVSK